jgi:hypothetical protein
MGYGQAGACVMSSLAELATIFLAPKDQDAVLGDLAETGASGWSVLGSVVGLVVRQQMELWRAWQPWVASSVALAGSLLLLGVPLGYRWTPVIFCAASVGMAACSVKLC